MGERRSASDTKDPSDSERETGRKRDGNKNLKQVFKVIACDSTQFRISFWDIFSIPTKCQNHFAPFRFRNVCCCLCICTHIHTHNRLSLIHTSGSFSLSPYTLQVQFFFDFRFFCPPDHSKKMENLLNLF